MITEQKSLELARLMEWHLAPPDPELSLDVIHSLDGADGLFLEPYEATPDGLAQFAAIFLKFPYVIDFGRGKWPNPMVNAILQQRILDDILRMNGVDIDAA